MYFKYKNSYSPENGVWWLYAKIVKHNDSETCQVFEFQRTSRENQFIAGLATPFAGSIDTNRYTYYQDLYDEISKEEFEEALKLFMIDFNNYIDFIRCSP